ncbi:MAG TPA: alpha/beta hydrolase [Pyrinomonadaceae bacterium]|nr:alpha/beta hydrolase [Pyrinomonadaceae bacterium]HLE64095.1 alpha/beta hydrolase [Pyrinomonadaceae bacterium]
MTNIILVHGAFVDASCWAPVIPILWNAGHRVIAVQSPMTNLSDDVTAVKKAMRELGSGPAVLVGHSYGGTVISAAASGERQVIGLVFLAALANDKGESVNDILRSFPPTDGFQALRKDDEGWVIIDRDAFPEVFAADVPLEQAEIMAASQPRLGPTCFDTPLPVEPAWKTIKSSYLICEHDRTVHPEGQFVLATKIGANVISVPASHAASISQSEAVAEAINQAAIRKAYVTG